MDILASRYLEKSSTLSNFTVIKENFKVFGYSCVYLILKVTRVLFSVFYAKNNTMIELKIVEICKNDKKMYWQCISYIKSNPYILISYVYPKARLRRKLLEPDEKLQLLQLWNQQFSFSGIPITLLKNLWLFKKRFSKYFH